MSGDNPSRNRENDVTSLTPIDSQRAVRGWLEEIAGSRGPAESVKGMLRRLADAVGLSPSRIKKLWYGESDKIGWHEAETIRRLAMERKQQVEDWADIAADRKIAEIVARLERLERDGKAQVERRAMAERPLDCDSQPTLDLGRASEPMDQRKQVT